jgi:predicted phosphohydrolase
VRVVCVSDTHLRPFEVPDGDVLVHAGDMTMGGSLAEVQDFARVFEVLPHPHKVLIAGNHDFAFMRRPEEARALLGSTVYLQDDGAEVAGLRVWGSPWQPRFGDWAFNLDRGAPLREKWDRIPERLDILVTHGPPEGIGDRTAFGQSVGCADLRDAVLRTRPRFHVFGHIHEGYGVLRKGETTYVNASVCTLQYRPTNAPIVLEV